MELIEEATITVEAGVAGDARGRLKGRQVTVLVPGKLGRGLSGLGSGGPVDYPPREHPDRGPRLGE